MPRHPHSRALKLLCDRDSHIASEFARIGLPPRRERPPGFPTILRIILGQQVSTAAANAMWTKMNAAIDPLTPEALLAHNAQSLRPFGLSRQKTVYALGLAADLVAGRVDLARVETMDDEAAIAELIKIKGIGRWSAEIYLLFALGRQDIWPAGDLALQVALQRLKGLRKRPDPKRMIKLAELWRPHRGAAAHFLWHYYANAPFTDGA
jgi:DNA-3-methyladenine glycosylase II